MKVRNIHPLLVGRVVRVSWPRDPNNLQGPTWEAVGVLTGWDDTGCPTRAQRPWLNLHFEGRERLRVPLSGDIKLAVRVEGLEFLEPRPEHRDDDED
jgi:hypothetical protein